MMENVAPGRSEEGQHDADEQAEPHAAQGTGERHPRVAEAPRHPLHHLEVVTHDGHQVHRELLVGEVVNGLLGVQVGRVRTDGIPGGDRLRFVRAVGAAGPGSTKNV